MILTQTVSNRVRCRISGCHSWARTHSDSSGRATHMSQSLSGSRFHSSRRFSLVFSSVLKQKPRFPWSNMTNRKIQKLNNILLRSLWKDRTNTLDFAHFVHCHKCCPESMLARSRDCVLGILPKRKETQVQSQGSSGLKSLEYNYAYL